MQNGGLKWLLSRHIIVDDVSRHRYASDRDNVTCVTTFLARDAMFVDCSAARHTCPLAN